MADAALALIELELPQWQVRRIAYDDGEWYCALSREREPPDWLDQSVEARHSDLALAILGALVEVRHQIANAPRTSVPHAPQGAGELYEPLLSDNFGWQRDPLRSNATSAVIGCRPSRKHPCSGSSRS